MLHLQPSFVVSSTQLTEGKATFKELGLSSSLGQWTLSLHLLWRASHCPRPDESQVLRNYQIWVLSRSSVPDGSWYHWPLTYPSIDLWVFSFCLCWWRQWTGVWGYACLLYFLKCYFIFLLFLCICGKRGRFSFKILWIEKSLIGLYQKSATVSLWVQLLSSQLICLALEISHLISRSLWGYGPWSGSLQLSLN